MAPEEDKRAYRARAARGGERYIFHAHIFSFFGGYIHFVGAILRHLTDNEKMVLLQTCDQLKPH